MTAVQPLVSIGIPVFNGEAMLPGVLDSIIAAADGLDTEIVISDNASTDGTRQIVEQYASRYDYIRPHYFAVNQGAAANYNRVLDLSSGRYFKWNAADDYMRPEFLRRCLERLRAKPEALGVFTAADYEDNAGVHLVSTLDFAPLAPWPITAEAQAKRYLQYAVQDGRVAMAGIMGVFRRESLAGLRIKNFYGTDVVFVLEVLLRGSMEYLDEPLLRFTRHRASSSYASVPDAARQQRFLDPRIKDRWRVELQHRRRYWELLRAINASNLPLVTRAALDWEMASALARKGEWFARTRLGGLRPRVLRT